MTIPAAITAAVSNANAMMGQGQGRMGVHHGGRGFDGRPGGPLMIIIPLLLIAAAAFGIGMFFRRRRGSFSVSPAVAGVAPSATTGPIVSGDDMAAAILRERFARGDINEVEFLHRKAVLEGRANVPTNSPAAPMTTGMTTPTPTPTTTSTPAPVASDDPTVVDGEPNDQTS